MKKQIKKLTLNRETLRSMVKTDLERAAGGSQEIEDRGATGVSNCIQCSQYWTQCFCM